MLYSLAVKACYLFKFIENVKNKLISLCKVTKAKTKKSFTFFVNIIQVVCAFFNLFF